MTLNWTARYIADWADVKPEAARTEHEQAYLAGADEFAQLDTPLEFASLYLTAKCHLQVRALPCGRIIPGRRPYRRCHYQYSS